LFLDATTNAVIFVVGNKIDAENPQSSKSDAEMLVNQNGWRLFFTSAKDGNGIKELFDEVCEEVSRIEIELKMELSRVRESGKNGCC
jgi:predicted GTPase